MPSRKKAKPGVSEDSESADTTTLSKRLLKQEQSSKNAYEESLDRTSLSTGDAKKALSEESSSRIDDDTASASTPNTPRSTKSWYGSWPRTPKAAPIAQVVNESISATSTTLAKATLKAGAPKSLPKAARPPQRASLSHLSPGSSSRSLPVTGLTTTVDVPSSNLDNAKAKTKKSLTDETAKQIAIPNTGDQNRLNGATQVSSKGTDSADSSFPKAIKEPGSHICNERPDSSGKSAASAALPPHEIPGKPKAEISASSSQATWMSWFARGGAGLEAAENHSATNNNADAQVESQDRTTNDTSKEAAPGDSSKHTQRPETPTQRRNSDPNPQPAADREAAEEPTHRSSWLGFWGTSKARPDRVTSILGSHDSGKAPSIRSSESLPIPAKAAKSLDDSEPAPPQKDVLPNSADIATTSSSWAFWSRTAISTTKENGTSTVEINPMSSTELSSETRKKDKTVPIGETPVLAINETGSALGKRARPLSVEFQTGEDKSKTASKATITDGSGNTAVGASATDRPLEKRLSLKDDSTTNLLLPLFKQTYPPANERWSLIQQISKFFYGKPPPVKHPTLIKDPSHIGHALAIGVHGYFPGAFIQTMIGRPTGTSVKFAESAACAIRRFTESRGYMPKSVQKIALEGEGRIEERLDILWKLLLNWIDTIRNADFILVACHSQGVPVAISLVAKLVGFGCVNGARIGICAMAGVNLGPFADYKSRFIGGSAGELFEFAKPDSNVSKGYETALDTVVRSGVKVTYIGSLDDQLVSLHSSTFGIVHHPNIYRAVWVDGRLHVPDFLTHLVGFALKLRNLGVSDHGLIRELSNPLAGSLVGGEGHSRIYDDPAVYDLAVEFVLETTCLNIDALKLDKPSQIAPQNPYILPFAMRGLLEEDFVRKELSTETVDLLQQFDDWKPATKVLRDVKYRLEGIRSKL